MSSAPAFAHPAPARDRRPRRGVAILGTGMIGDVHRRAAVLAGAEVVGVLASSPQRSRQAAAEWQVTTGYRDLEEVLADDRVQVVHVCTPNATHAQFAEAVLMAGKHVICEKPIGISVDEAASMTRLAADTGLVATVPFVYRYHPMVRELRARRLNAEFGDWNLVHGSYLQDWMLSPDVSGWRVDPALGGRSRAFADIGSHWCDLVEWVSGEQFAELVAMTSVAVRKRPVPAGGFPASADPERATKEPISTEDSAVLMLRTATGVPASAAVSQVSAGRKNRLWFELDGSTSSAVFDQENPESLWIGTQEGAQILVRDTGSGSAEQQRLSQLPAGHSQGYAQCFEAFVADTYAAVDGGLPPGLPTFQDGLRSARIVDAVLRSAHNGSWTEV